MTIDDFSAPLGQHTRPQNRGLRISASRIAIGAGAFAAVLATAWAITTDSPLRGRPDAIASAPEVTAAQCARNCQRRGAVRPPAQQSQ